MRSRPSVLTIAGSDSGGGAGIQADLKAITARGVHAATAITAVTAQNSRQVTAIEPLPISIVEAQIDAVMSDLQPSTIKIGMLGTAELVRTVAAMIEKWRPRFVVLDPVMIASSGARLLDEDAVATLRARLLPLATVLTPNWPEAEAILERTLAGRDALEDAAAEMAALGAQAVLFKGGHLDEDEMIDTLWIRDGRWETFRAERIRDAEGHGTGCTLASAVAAGLALGEELEEACRKATALVHRALEDRYSVGSSKPLFLATDGAER